MAIQWEKLTVKSQEAVQAAVGHASENGNPEVLPVHLMAALLEDREGVVLPVLEKVGVPVEQLLAGDYNPGVVANGNSQGVKSMATMTAIQPGAYGFPVNIRAKYDNYIGGAWVAPASGEYFENVTPVTGQPLCQIARSNAKDIDRALDAAHGAKAAWGKTSLAERGRALERIAQKIEDNLEMLATVETWDNGKPIRETMAADLPLVVDHFRYFAGVIRAQEGSICEIDATTVAYHYHEPLGVIGLIVPWNFPLLMAAWKLAPALAAGNAVVLKPAEQTPMSILVLMELIDGILPPGVLNVVNGFGLEAGKPLASSNRINKVAFTGETTTGRLIMQYASQNIIPVTLELGG